jgi:transposase
MSNKHTISQNSGKPRNGLTHRNKLGFIDPTIAGIDIGANLIHVAIPNTKKKADVFEFGTTTPELRRIAQELKKSGVKTAVMEATGVYWAPLYEILEDLGFNSVLVDAKAVKNVPGRKSDVHDAQWIQTLYSNGLLRAAFRPPRERLALRAFVRQRQSIIKTRQRALLHMEKAMQLMNIKLSGALSDIGGFSGMEIMRAILNGERDPVKLASLRNKKCKKLEEEFVAALTGNFRKEHIFSLKQAMDLYDFTGQQLNECDQNIKNELEILPTITDKPLPKRDKDKKANGKYKKAQKPRKNTISFNVKELLWQKSGIDATCLDGIEENSALLLFAELGGTDVSSWSRDKEFASWLKLCPGNNISGGKRRKSKKQPCANYISQCFRLASLSAKKSDSALGAKIRCISGRADKPKGIKAGAHSLAVLYYNMCKYGWDYHRKGAADYERAHNERRLESIKRSARSLGYDLVPKAA